MCCCGDHPSHGNIRDSPPKDPGYAKLDLITCARLEGLFDVAYSCGWVKWVMAMCVCFFNLACYSLELYKCKVPFDCCHHEITIRVRLVHFFQPPLNLEYLATSYPHAPNVWNIYLPYYHEFTVRHSGTVGEMNIPYMA